jgi:hypothetical protein
MTMTTRALLLTGSCAATAVIVLSVCAVLNDASVQQSVRTPTSGTLLSQSVRDQLGYAYPSSTERDTWCADQAYSGIAAARVAEWIAAYDTSDGIEATPGDIKAGMAMFCEADQ